MAKKKENSKAKKDDSIAKKEDPKTTKVRMSDDPVPKKERWVNRQRVLVMATRGISYTHRHMMKDVERLMPHSRHGNKMERKENLNEVNEICALRNCNKAVLFEGRLQRDLYMWVSNVPVGPSVKFLVESIYTSGELKLTGNCLTGSRPLLSFDNSFIEHPHFSLLRELFVQTFGVPNHHPKSQPFVDHVLTFSVLDNRIWCRNYQIISEQGALAEIGPRYVLNPIKIFEGSFSGATLWENPQYITPAKTRRALVQYKTQKTAHRKEQKIRRKKTNIENPEIGENEIYGGNTEHMARRIMKREAKKGSNKSSQPKKKQKMS
ncbi:ribosome biogenesis protein BRX1 homolog [Planococcus citri]|uniref:ribosome biogenesis protein BRX1 homolog n=1 Tax=Planococcus citri TaxID=170843 RepID=UPI0031F960B4